MLGIRDLNAEFANLTSVGVGLTLDERMNLELSLMKIFKIDDFEEVLFWGKISGVTRDYFIAMALNYKGFYEFPHKRYFWCNNQTWAFEELPNIHTNDAEHAENINTVFMGEPENVIIEAPREEQDSEAVAQSESDKDSLASTEEEKIPPKDFKELDRLAYVVRAIDHETSVVPKGAFKLNPDHEIERNLNYDGLGRANAVNINSYQHFRNIRFEGMRDALDKDDAVLSPEILDELDRDQPEGCWSIQNNGSGAGVVVRSLLWPGYFAYAECHGAKFGGVYIGDGIKNADLPFML